jgi:putative flippase GtrA
VTRAATASTRTVQIVRFFVVGVLSLAVDLGVLWVLHGLLGVWLPLAAALSFLSSFVVNFGLNQRWTFNATEGSTPAQLVRYTILVAANTLATAIAVTAITNTGVDYLIAKLMVVVVLTATNFVLMRIWVFRERHLHTLAGDPQHVPGQQR